jgi:capsular polysaccharide biosynthesis protein/Flp pilus assembly protein TadD
MNELALAHTAWEENLAEAVSPATMPASLPATEVELLRKGIELHRVKDLSAAKEIYLELLRRNAANADPWHLLGLVCLQKGEPEAAIPLIAQAIEIDSSVALYFCNLAYALTNTNKLRDAEAVLRHAIALDPKFAAAHHNLGCTLARFEHSTEALKCYERALELQPDYADAQFGIGVLHEAQGHYDTATSWFERTKASDSYHSPARFHLAHMRLLKGRIQDALEEYRAFKQAERARDPTLTGTEERLLPLMFVQAWCERSQNPFLPIESQSRQVIQGPVFHNSGLPALPPAASDVPLRYLAQIRDVSVIGWSDVLVANEGACALYDLAASNHDDELECEHPPAVIVSPRHAILEWRDGERLEAQKGIVLVGRGWDSYAHWVFDFLPKLGFLANYPGYEDWPVLVDEGLYSQQLEAVRLLAGPNHKVIGLKAHRSYRLDQVVVLSDFSAMRRQSYRPFTTPGANEAVISPLAVEFLREHVGRLYSTSTRAGKKFYVSRRHQTKFRRLENEHDVEALCVRRGFEVVYPEQLAFEEQVRLFSQAQVIVGPGGSNMVNTVFAPQGTKVLILACWSPRINYYFFANLAQQCNHQLAYVLGEATGRHSLGYQNDYVISLNELDSALMKLD